MRNAELGVRSDGESLIHSPKGIVRFLLFLPILYVVMTGLANPEATGGTGDDMRFAVTTFAVYDSLKDAGWPISPVPTWKPDSSLVLFDVNGDVPFSPEQILALDDLGAVIIAESGIQEYLSSNSWIVERQFP